MANLTTIETAKLREPLPLQLSMSALIPNGDKFKQQTINCKLVTELNKENDAITFTYFVSQYIKADSLTKNRDGKYSKTLVEEFIAAKVYHFSDDFTLSVEYSTNSLFPNGGHVVDNEGHKLDSIRTRVELVNLFESLIFNGKIDFLIYTEVEGKKQILHAYDPSILILKELLEVAQVDPKPLMSKDGSKFKMENKKYLPIPDSTILASFVNAAKALKDINYPLMEGNTIKSLSDYASQELKLIESATAKSATAKSAKVTKPDTTETV